MRADASECPRCGVIYAKAEAHAAAVAVAVPPLEATGGSPEPDGGSTWPGEADDAVLEQRLRAFGIPAALLIAWLAVHTGLGHFLLRTFLSMWVHEIGHAVAAWLCGYPAFPAPWFTPVADQRSALFVVLVASGLAFAAARSWSAERRVLACTAAALLVLQLCCTTLLRPDSARQLIVFAGDGGCLVLGAFLMASVYAPRGSAIERGWLRWGFLAIGSASFADAFSQWWSARHDYDSIPFGRNEGVGLSDPSVLTETFDWTTGALVHRYVAVGCVCLAALAALYAVGLARSGRPAADRRA